MGRFWEFVVRSPTLARGAAVVALCVVTTAVQMADFRYATLRSSLVPGMFMPHWGVSRTGVGVFRDDLSLAVLSRAPGRPAPFLVRDIPNFRQAPAVRIGIEARAQDLVAGEEFWQSARIMLWSYGSEGRHLRYMPSEVLRLDRTEDWTRASLVVPVMPETVGMKLVIIQAALAGSLVVRGISVDGVGETQIYLITRGVLIALWLAAAIWVLVPMFRHFSRLRAAVAVILAMTLAGALTPQPELSNALFDAAANVGRAVEPARHALARWVSPPPAVVESAPIETLEPSGGEPAQSQASTSPQEAAPAQPPQTTAPRAAAPAATATSLITDFTPRPSVKFGHFLAFAVLALILPFAFPAARWWHVFSALILFGVSIEMVQGFSITRSPEPSDVVRDGLGAALGLALAVAWQFARELRKKPA